MKTCAACGSSGWLRFDRGRQQWVCSRTCSATTSAKRPPNRKREALFSIWVLDETGERTRATRDYVREASRLWYRHRDIREGRAHA